MLSEGSKRTNMTPSVIMFLTLITYVNAAFYQDDWVSQMIVKRQSGRFCGRALDDILKLVCNGSFQTVFEDKRSAGANKFRAAVKFGHYPYNRISNSMSIFPVEFRRKRRQIVDECCLESCTLNELRGYCSQS